MLGVSLFVALVRTTFHASHVKTCHTSFSVLIACLCLQQATVNSWAIVDFQGNLKVQNTKAERDIRRVGLLRHTAQEDEFSSSQVIPSDWKHLFGQIEPSADIYPISSEGENIAGKIGRQDDVVSGSGANTSDGEQEDGAGHGGHWPHQYREIDTLAMMSAGYAKSSVASHQTVDLHTGHDNLTKRYPEGGWLKPIERRPAASLSYDEFYNKYKRHGIPVIIEGYMEGWSLLKWTVQHLQERCGNRFNVSLGQKVYNAMMSMKPTTFAALKVEYEQLFNGASFDKLLDELHENNRFKPMRLGDFIEYALAQSKIPRPARQDYNHLAHFLHPLTVHHNPVKDVCRDILEDLVIPKYFASSFVSTKSDSRSAQDPLLQPIFYLAPANSRSFPTHFHGREYRDNMIMMLSGAKHFVHWDYEDQPNLYQIDGIDTANNDPLFFANPIPAPNITRQPLLAYAHGYSGVARRGDLLFMPSGGIHIVENTGEGASDPSPTFGILLPQRDRHTLLRNEYLHQKRFKDGQITKTELDDFEHQIQSLLQGTRRYVEPRDMPFSVLEASASGAKDDGDPISVADHRKVPKMPYQWATSQLHDG